MTNRQSRAVFMSAGGDPFISLTVLKLFQERWSDEVDKFYICYNTDINKAVANEFIEKASEIPKVEVLYFDHGIGNGQPINEMLKVAEEELILLLEDDGFIFTRGEVDAAFHQIEEGKVDAIGSPRFSCGQEIGEALGKKYKLDYTGYGDVGPNFWPNFFFCKKADLLATDLDFASHKFEKDTYYPELDHTMSVDEYGDTFVWACVQMRHNGVRFGTVPQKHASPYEIADKERHEGNWISPIRWLHGGSLSTGWSGYLAGGTPDVSHEISKLEIETRVAFWQICLDQIEGFNGFCDEYQTGINDLIQRASLDHGRILQKITIYKELMGI